MPFDNRSRKKSIKSTIPSQSDVAGERNDFSRVTDSHFHNKRAKDFVGRRLMVFPVSTNSDVYRRMHMAHDHGDFGSDEPDPPYPNYPITTTSSRRKLVRDVTRHTGLRLLRDQLAGIAIPVPVVRRTLLKILLVKVVFITISIVFGVWRVYPLF